ncbi:sulfur oxidation c-type cytochrome SoxA [Halarcobacter mediterraneus]|uniref:L-cysteine S-thiosulfotransferase subunit SoxA n=1 Tax=Halarcobacter mediterraneus TaxID=2023153 RepID=A0A4V1M1L1_9BACT|nr:sulfur oxidation c-type cytochrome SoxA [Halarcobacter mediterraneus]RXK14256.1 sulfur oxidation c-type cytochrome SoxA [Halarcobacter mediterraneus]
MLLKIAKTTALTALAVCTLNAADFNAQAEKDRLALVKYFEAKFDNPEKNRATFFPYSTDDELKNNIISGVKFEEFSIGNYAFSKNGRVSYEEINEFPPYEEFIEHGEELYEKEFANGKSLATCFPNPAEAGSKYPFFDEERKEVMTLTVAINECRTSNGEKKWNEKKGDMAHVQSFFASSARDEEKIVDVKIQSAEAAAAYERGKEYYYTQRGYLKLNCAECHVQGAALRVRNESLSQLLGQTTHFPVYRLKWGAASPKNDGLGTLERRMSGCVKDQGQVPPKNDSQEMRELLFFMAYMSNGLKFDGPDIRK